MAEEFQPKRGRLLSFKYAFVGLKDAVKEEPHLKFHLSFALLVVAFGFYFNISRLDWITVIILIGLVLTAELTNTAIEAVVDSFTQREHPTAKYAKDIASGAVLILAIVSVITGAIIFLPYLLPYLSILPK